MYLYNLHRECMLIANDATCTIVHPRVCTRYEIQSLALHLQLTRHKFAKNLLRYCLIKRLNREKCSTLITAVVHTHYYQGYKIYLKHNAIDHYSVDCNIFSMLCLPKFKPLKYKQFYNFGLAFPFVTY